MTNCLGHGPNQLDNDPRHRENAPFQTFPLGNKKKVENVSDLFCAQKVIVSNQTLRTCKILYSFKIDHAVREQVMPFFGGGIIMCVSGGVHVVTL
jgi:hypothetical protein